MGIGDWGLGIGDWGLGPIPNPKSPIPNPQSPIPIPNWKNIKYFFINNFQLFSIIQLLNFKKWEILLIDYQILLFY